MDAPLAASPVLVDLVWLAGVLHFCQLPGTIITYRILGWRDDLAALRPITRRIMVVTALGVTLAVVGLGAIVVLFAAEVVGGTGLGTGIAGFLTIFWGFRGAVQIFVYRERWPGHLSARVCHYALVVLFMFLTLVYALAFVMGLASGRMS